MTSDLAARGAARVEWIRSRMLLLARTRADFAETLPFQGHRIGMSLHLEPKTAVLLETLAAGGAELVATGNHGSTQDDVVAYLKTLGITVFGARDDDLTQHLGNVASVIEARPTILLDNGADLAAIIASSPNAATGAGAGTGPDAGTGAEAGTGIIGGTEETTSGGVRLRGELAGRIPFPMIVINDSLLKAIGENKHAVGQSVVESFMRITNMMINGRRFVVAGYGWCGSGIAHYLRAFGGKVAVVEVDELKAFEAAMDGFRVDTAINLASWGEVFFTATGHPEILSTEFFERVEDGALLLNCGHFPWEIDVPALRALSTGSRMLDDAIERIELPGGRHVILIADGRMMNLAGREPKGNSLEAMDLGFLLQTLSLERVATATATLTPGAQPVPDDLDREIARRMVTAMSAER
ncbi:MAG: adenosylhomocysteinase [Salinibacterium sp.]|nr:adenosylhomocysteinase [Salinibacterium sp.]